MERSGRHRLLIVDDEPKVCDMLVQLFTAKGYDALAVGRGEDALALTEAFHPQTVLLDLLMPGMSGIDTLRQLKQLVPPPRVIMLSGADLDEVVQGALQLGADAYVVKPVDVAKVEHLITGFWPSR